MPELSAAMTAYIIIIAAILGLCMGSFLNCFAYRYINHESVLKGRSHCALCGHDLKAPDLVPVFSWLFLRGRCRYCGERISPRYVLAELICAAAYVSVFLRFGLSVDTAKYLILVSLLFTASFADIHGGLIPDRLVIIGGVSAFAFAFFPAEGTIPASLLSTLLGGLSIALPVLLIVLALDKLLGRETMGGGDIKLMFLIGLHFDWKLNILILILACVIGLVFAFIKRSEMDSREEAGGFSFGPALALAAWLVMLWGEPVIDWYLGFFI